MRSMTSAPECAAPQASKMFAKFLQLLLMRTYVQFFQAGANGTLIEACGDRSVVRLDGRQSALKHEVVAEQECKARKYVAWQLIKGPSLLSAKPATCVVPLYY